MKLDFYFKKLISVHEFYFFFFIVKVFDFLEYFCHSSCFYLKLRQLLGLNDVSPDLKIASKLPFFSNT